jgi:hypothetical protein
LLTQDLSIGVLGELEQSGHTHPHHLDGRRRIFVAAEVGDGPGHVAKEGHRDSWSKNTNNLKLVGRRGLFSGKRHVTEKRIFH